VWQELILGLNPENEISAPASPSMVDAIERSLGQSVPVDLKHLLLEVNGVMDRWGTEVIWPAKRIIGENSFFRTDSALAELYGPFERTMFFGDNGGGDQFAFLRDPDRNEVFVWDHETDERRMVAESLERYVIGCLSSHGEDWYRP
jgi:SMI1-KNR4 cell-wall